MAGARQERRFKLVTRLSPSGAPKVRFTPAAQSPPITDSQILMHSAYDVYYSSREKKRHARTKIGGIGRVWIVAFDHLPMFLIFFGPRK